MESRAGMVYDVVTKLCRAHAAKISEVECQDHSVECWRRSRW